MFGSRSVAGVCCSGGCKEVGLPARLRVQRRGEGIECWPSSTRGSRLTVRFLPRSLYRLVANSRHHTAVPGPPAKTPTDFGLSSDFSSKRAPKTLDELKLGPAPLDPKLQREIARAVRDDEGAPAPAPAPAPAGDGTTTAEGSATGTPAPADPNAPTTGDVKPTAPIATDFADGTTSTVGTAADGTSTTEAEGGLPELISPFPAELPPYPTTLRTIDVAREVEKVREVRKRIKLGAEAYAPGATGQVVTTAGKAKEKSEAAKPSVCLFTIHDAGER